jgi:hypothetical protein
VACATADHAGGYVYLRRDADGRRHAPTDHAGETMIVTT